MLTRYRHLFLLPLLAVTTVALAVDVPANLPKRKAGLWEMQMGSAGGKPQMVKVCLDEASDRAMYEMGAKIGGSVCSKFSLSVNGNVVVADGVCSLPGPQGNIVMTSHSETRFTGDTAYQTQGTVKLDPPVNGNGEMSVSNGGHWVGQCTAGMKPGDMLLPDGRTMNFKDMGQQ
ncbi:MULTISPECIES: DUF3617 domain-containing protein [Dyella]|nr:MULTISPECIES: DUF3617 family protein [Dyella]